VNNKNIDSDQICEVEEELCLCPGPSAHTITGGHMVTFVHITCMGVVVLMTRGFMELLDSSLKYTSAGGAWMLVGT
jgi:hypothetical protein